MLPLLFFLLAAGAHAQVDLTLVSARAGIEGGLILPQTVYADATHIYLATVSVPTGGRLYVLKRDRAANFPVAEQRDFAVALGGVRGDADHLYVAGRDGIFYIFRKTSPLTFVTSVRIADNQLLGLEVVGDRIYVAVGQAHVAADARHVYLSAGSPADTVVEIVKGTWARGRTYGTTFEPTATVVFDRLTGARLSAIQNPADTSGDRSLSALYADPEVVGQVRPGCCGLGISLFDPETLAFDQRIASQASDSLARRGRWLLVGTEFGTVEVWDIGRTPAPRVASVDLRALTGHQTFQEDIEIRALWFDEVDRLLFAGSSWGNDQSRSPALPAFFVLELTTSEPVVSVSDVRVSEGAAGTTSATFTVTLSAASTQPVTVDFATADGTATAGSDYVATAGRLTFPPGIMLQTVTVAVNSDSVSEPDETFFVDLTNPMNATLSRRRGTATIANAAPAAPVSVSVAATTPTAIEGTTNGVVTVTRSGSTATPLAVRYTVSGSAAAGVDYTALPGTLTIPAGLASASIAVAALADAVTEGGETVIVTLSSDAAYAVASPGTATVTIADNRLVRVTFTSPAAGATVKGTAWTDIWVDGATGASNTFTLTVGGLVVATQTIAGVHATLPWDTTRVSDGAQTTVATVRDAGGAAGSASRAVVVNNGAVSTPPPSPLSASFTAPAAGATVSGVQTVGMAVSGATGSANAFRLALDTTDIFATTTAATSASFAWNSGSATPGSHTLRLTVTDAGGRVATATRAVTVPAPTTVPAAGALRVSITQPTAGAIVSATTWAVVWVEGQTGSANTFTLSVAGRVVATSTTADRMVSLPWDTLATADGAQILTATVRDAAGGTGTAALSLTVRNGAVAPAPAPAAALRVTITQPLGGAVAAGTTWVVVWVENQTGTANTFTLSAGGRVVASGTGDRMVSLPWNTLATANGTQPLTATVRDSTGATGSTQLTVTVRN